MKIAIIGAGNVGATLAVRVLEKDFANVVIVDVKGGLAKGKSLDLSDAAYLARYESHIFGTTEFKEIENSSLVVITAGLARTPGMSREELLSKNKKIVEEVCSNIKKYAPHSIVIVVTNPLDIMTYIAYKICGFSRKKIFGMGGDLDASRFIELISQKLNIERSSVNTIVMGSHGDTMVPIVSHTRISGKPLDQLLPKEDINSLIEATKNRGAEIVSLLERGSAYYAPSAAIANLIETILMNKKRIHYISAFLEGEYGLTDVCIGVPVLLGRNGIEEILKIGLSPSEEKAFEQSAQIIRNNLKNIRNI